MSIGIGAIAHLILCDDKTVAYQYGSYNLNKEKFRNAERICDGCISIKRSCFVEPNIHTKIKKMPSGRKKLIVKRVNVSVDYANMINDGLILVENCSNCWETTSDKKHTDIVALRLLFYIFEKYQNEGAIPKYIGYNV